MNPALSDARVLILNDNSILYCLWYSALYTDISLKKNALILLFFLMFETTAINGVIRRGGFPVNEGLGQSWWLVLTVLTVCVKDGLV